MPDDGPGIGRHQFYRVVNEAIADLAEHGYDDPKRVEQWVRRIRQAAMGSLVPEEVLVANLSKSLRATYDRLINHDAILKFHPGVSRFTLANVKPKLHAELERRIVGAANLIKLNRTEAIETTLRRFEGWATSIPAGGSNAIDRRETSKDVRKSLSSLPFRERRVAIDQAHKFSANLSNMLATDGGAIAAEWHSHYRQAGYNFREEHKERDGVVYVIRDNWAVSRGLMKPAGRKYLDQITQPGEEVSCRCFASYIYTLPKLPPDMVTDKGRAELAKARASLQL